MDRTRFLMLMFTAFVLVTPGCAAKNRWFTRKDYSEMQDPFLSSGALASSEKSSADAKTADAAKGSSGRARLDDSSTPATAGTTNGLRSGMDTPNRADPRVTTAAYPARDTGIAPSATATGPSLSDFLDQKKTVTAASATLHQMPGNAFDSAMPHSRPLDPRSPASRVAALPDADAADFDQFLLNGGTKSAAADRKPGSHGDAKNRADENTEDFAAWAAQQQQSWNTKSTATNVAPSTASSTAGHKSASVSQPSGRPAVQPRSQFSSSDFEASFSLTPSANTPPGNQATPTRDEEFQWSAAEDKPAGRVPNPFDNPLDVMDSAPRTANTKAPARKSTPQALDDSFQMDSGWKPSNFTP